MFWNEKEQFSGKLKNAFQEGLNSPGIGLVV